MLPNDSDIFSVSKLLELAQDFEKKGNLQAAVDTYRHALAQLPEDSILKKELHLIIDQLESRSTLWSKIGQSLPFEWSRPGVWIFGLIGLVVIATIIFLLTRSDEAVTTAPTPASTPVPTESPVPEPSPTTEPSPVPTKTVEIIVVSVNQTKTVSPTPKIIVLTVKARRVALRAGPNLNHALVSGFYPTGTAMIALEKHEDWFHVEAPDGKRGWLFIGWLSIESSLVNEIPLASNIPTPPFFTLTPTPKPGISYP